MILRNWYGKSITHRLTCQVILLSSLVALLSTGVQLFFEYRQDLRDIYNYFSQVERSSLRPLEESVWLLDDLQITLQLEGLIMREHIVHAAVEMDGQIPWARGILVNRNLLTKSFPLHHLTGGQKELIAHLHLTASLEGVYQRLWQRIIMLLCSNAVKTFLVSGLILLLLQKSLTQHLVRLASYARSIEIKHPAPVHLKRCSSGQDELDQVASAINQLCHTSARTMQELETQSQRLRLYLEATEEAVLGVDTAGRCTFINRVGLEHFAGREAKTCIGTNVLIMLASDVPGVPHSYILSGLIRASMTQGEPLLADEVSLILPDGTPLLISLRSYPVLENGICTGAVVFYADVSRKQQLEQEKQLFAKVVRQAPALIIITDPNGVVEYINAAFEQAVGSFGRSLVGQYARDCFEELQITAYLDQVREKIQAGSTWNGTLTFCNFLGHQVVLEAAIFPIFSPQGQVTNLVAMGRDISREQLLTRQLHHAQKMEAMGKLASSISHEFGNPLLGIRFALQDVQQRMDQNSADAKVLRLAEQECDRMRRLIRNLQQFNRPSTGRNEAFDLHQTLEAILALHYNLLRRYKITLTKVYCPGELWCFGVEDQIRQVFINLIINAVDAMAGQGGVLTLTTAQSAARIVVAVEDTGPGIAPEHLERIFEPFFTTKAAVEGSGLGLAVSEGIVRAHGGSLEVQSEPGQTSFRVVLATAGPLAGQMAER